MMGLPLPELMAGIILLSLVIYALLAGADFGGGVWDLLARGPRAEAQRDVIAHAIGPIWEANHVWMILAVVLLFSCFPPAFAAIMTALHIPVTLMLIGIVLRGSSFVFRTYDVQEPHVVNRWGRVFAVSSVFTPVLLGIIVGALSSRRIRLEDGIPVDGFVATWAGPFPLAVGLFALTLFAFLAATYLTLEAKEEPLREDFRGRALASAAALAGTAVLVWLMAGEAAPEVRTALATSAWGWPLKVGTAAVAAGAVAALWFRRYILARILAALQVSLILGGWGAAMFPWLIAGEMRLHDVAAPEATLRLVLLALVAGSLLLVPALVYLYVTFKGRSIFLPLAEEAPAEER